MFRAASLGAALFAAWLLLSGIYQPLLIGLGIASCALVVFLAHRMEVIDQEGHPVHLSWRAPGYWVWLTVEVIKANVDVARRIVDPSRGISPTMIKVPTSQRTDLGRVIYANSITLTPGTISVIVDDDSITVHALSHEGAADLEGGEMDRRCTLVEGGR